MRIGAWYLGNNRCEFTVWAPFLEQVAVQIISPDPQLIALKKNQWGYWQAIADHISPQTLYFYQLNGHRDRPDPASQFQPQGIHGPSEVVDHPAFFWTDANWQSIPLADLIVYEIHVGTFTETGTFEAIIPRLHELVELGINAIELMPIAQFGGDRNWGYDGVYPYAPQNSYGGAVGLKKLVDAAHQQGVAVILDAVYNHFGPDGNYIGDYGPYFTNAYQGVWGNAINFDQEYSYGVRNYFIQNALYWFEHYHLDGLRLDASDHIYDLGAKHFLTELSEQVAAFSQQQGRSHYLMAENDLSAERVTRSLQQGGYGIDVQWNDGFHHCVHALLTGETAGYYEDFGQCEQLAKAYKQTFVYAWDYSPFRKRWHGSDVSDRPGEQFLVFIQNHDQVGNRMLGERLTHLVSFEALKLAAATHLLAPNIPLIFMGEEYAEEAPFLYFISHTDPDLIQRVREGRQQDFAAFHLQEKFMEPDSHETFEQSKLHWQKRQEGKHKILLDLYQYLIRLRRTIPALKQLNKQSLNTWVIEAQKLLFLHRWSDESQVLCMMNFNQTSIVTTPEIPSGTWHKILESAEPKWMGSHTTLPDQLSAQQELTLQPQSFGLYQTSPT